MTAAERWEENLKVIERKIAQENSIEWQRDLLRAALIMLREECRWVGTRNICPEALQLVDEAIERTAQ